MANVTPLGRGTYRVELDGRQEVVHVAAAGHDRWAFWKGRVFRRTRGDEASVRSHATGPRAAHSLTAPMPATIVDILVEPGTVVKEGDTLLVAEAMKMELPIRAVAGGRVTAVRCHVGERVEADQVLVELE